MRIPLLKGRSLTERDTQEDIIPILIDQAAARRYWPGTDALGAYTRIGGPEGSRGQVVGIVGDVRNDGLRSPPVPEVFLSSAIAPPNPMSVLVRSPLPPETLVPQLRQAVQRVDSEQPIHSIQTGADLLQSSVSRERLQSFMVGFFAIAALLMAVLGVYGIVAYAVRQRRVEIGTRMAIGAAKSDLLALVVGDGLRMAAWGIGIGIAAVGLSTWFLSQKIPGISLADPLLFLLSTFTVMLLCAAACIVPGWRAAQISPMAAIRDDARPSSEPAAVQPDPPPGFGEAELLADIVEAGRHADSFAAVAAASLERLRERLNAESASLFSQRERGMPYRE